MDTIEGIILTDLKKIPTPKGMVFHGLKASEESYKGFGEAYFSSVNEGEIKGWKRHSRMTLNLIVISGEIEFTIHDTRNDSTTMGCVQKISLSRDNYKRLTLPPNLWFAFKGISASENILLDIINEEHDPTEAETLPLEVFNIIL